MLIDFYCPLHGQVMATFKHALVQCRCGEDAAPEGTTAAEHRKYYFGVNRQRRARKSLNVTSEKQDSRSERFDALKTDVQRWIRPAHHSEP